MNAPWPKGRTEPYTEAGIKRVKCIRCDNKAHANWNICADGGKYRPICKQCDIDLNELVLRWFNHPDADALMAKYRAASES